MVSEESPSFGGGGLVCSAIRFGGDGGFVRRPRWAHRRCRVERYLVYPSSLSWMLARALVLIVLSFSTARADEEARATLCRIRPRVPCGFSDFSDKSEPRAANSLRTAFSGHSRWYGLLARAVWGPSRLPPDPRSASGAGWGHRRKPAGAMVRSGCMAGASAWCCG